ncbi:TRAP transporter substrate-binding protein [Thalassobacillus pellis]|uniref:TRAP transporter substrate-binding protein n=1 Tax=Thalassobacillus pellis TaxID=748008 RepID=UPI00195FA89B|nr:TRAP transporter substrate-binding protein [Thalassobacillus pellis]MBM7551614.1 tripartite ATP-independent transporter DctP family solute receptor [Thalassobacillus pellis]
MKLKSSLMYVFISLFAFTVLLAGCSNNSASGDGGGTKTIKVANYFAPDHPQNIALKEVFKPVVEEESNGKIKVEVYPNSQLGAEQEFYDGVRNGTIEMGIPGMIMQNTLPKMGVPEWPFLFEDFEHVKKVLTGPIGEELMTNLEKEHGVHPLAWSANGFRMFSSNQPIKSMEDFKGLRLRMPKIDSYINVGKALGTNVTPMPISEVFSALEQGVIDGQDNPIATVRASKWYEVQTHELESRHMFSPNLYVINSNFWNGLSKKQQKIIESAAKKSANHEWELLAKSYEEDKKYLQEQGMKFITPTKEFKEKMKQAVEPLYEEHYKKYPWAKDLVERIRKAAE